MKKKKMYKKRTARYRYISNDKSLFSPGTIITVRLCMEPPREVNVYSIINMIKYLCSVFICLCHSLWRTTELIVDSPTLSRGKRDFVEAKNIFLRTEKDVVLLILTLQRHRLSCWRIKNSHSHNCTQKYKIIILIRIHFVESKYVVLKFGSNMHSFCIMWEKEIQTRSFRTDSSLDWNKPLLDSRKTILRFDSGKQREC